MDQTESIKFLWNAPNAAEIEAHYDIIVNGNIGDSDNEKQETFTDGWIIRKIAEKKLQNTIPNLWTGSRPKIPIGEPVLAVLWKTTPNKYQLPSHLSLFNTIYCRGKSGQSGITSHVCMHFV